MGSLLNNPSNTYRTYTQAASQTERSSQGPSHQQRSTISCRWYYQPRAVWAASMSAAQAQPSWRQAPPLSFRGPPPSERAGSPGRRTPPSSEANLAVALRKRWRPALKGGHLPNTDGGRGPGHRKPGGPGRPPVIFRAACGGPRGAPAKLGAGPRRTVALDLIQAVAYG